jgi:hypothetical protein
MAADEPAAGTPPEPPRDEAPPVGRSWGRLYAVVVAWLVVTVALLTFLTWAYR